MPALEAKDSAFFLDGKEIRLLSGAIHYFRVIPEYWEDRLLKLKACGLNCVETYVAWNLHEQTKGEFNFEGILDIRRFVEIAKRLGLHVILRPGPYICAEWDLGGLPSWLLRDPGMKLRSSYQPFITAVESYLTKLLSVVGDMQRSSGGPIIAVQVENEYGSYGEDDKYKTLLTEMFKKVGVTELLFTSDNGGGIRTGHIPGVLETANFQEVDHGFLMFEYLKNVRQPGMPLMVMEFWTGWFDRWSEKHHLVDNDQFEKTLRWLLGEGASVNFYMFHGGTNFGFMNGASGDSSELGSVGYTPMITSYDYDAPIAENGDLTEKYFIIQKVLRELFPDIASGITDHPAKVASVAYGQLKINGWLKFDDVLQHVESVNVTDPLTMEQLPINSGNGQSHGFILYRQETADNTNRLTLPGTVNDRAIVMLNGKIIDVVDWSQKNHETKIVPQSGTKNTLDILVENCGRVNYAEVNSPLLNAQLKGLKEIRLNKQPARNWTIFPLEMKAEFIESVWKSDKWADGQTDDTDGGPVLCRASLVISETPKDTHINMTRWKRGVIFVNGFNIGRYWDAGPQRTLYIPGPLLKVGENQILIFELHCAATEVTFNGQPDLGETVIHKAVLPLKDRLQITALQQILKLGNWVWPVVNLVMK